MAGEHPRTPEGMRAGLAAGDAQSGDDVGQICEYCEDNWVEVGAIDQSAGKPIAGLPYKVFDIDTKEELASGVLDENGKGPRHKIPVPNTQLFVVFGTDAAIDDTMEQIDALQTQQTLQNNAVSEWRGFEAGLTKEQFSQRHRTRIENGDFVDADRGWLEGAASGAQGLGNLAGSLLTGQGLSGWAESEYARRRDNVWNQYQLATGARTASAVESFGGGSAAGLTFNFDDEVGARLASLFDERSYEELVDARRLIAQQRQISNPGWYMGGEIAGTVPTILVPVGGAAANTARAGRGIGATMRSGGVTGGALGTIAGAGSGEGGVIERLDDAAIGGITGGVGGALFAGAGAMIARGVAKTRIWAKFRRARAFPKEAGDPARRVMGPATKSHPEELAKMKADIEASGVKIKENPGRTEMAYSPGSPGKPGELIIDPDASFAAWKHEYQHILDDQASGWRGWEALVDNNTRWQWEQRAYAEEMRVVRRAGHLDVIQEIEVLKTQEWNKIFRGKP